MILIWCVFLKTIEEISLELHSDKDLFYVGSRIGKVHVHVLEEVYELIGEISSSDEEYQVDEKLESYLYNTNFTSPDSQGMACTRQTIRKQEDVQ